MALLRKLAEQPADSVQRLLDLVREDDAREEERERQRLLRERREDLKGGAILIAAGIGISIMLAMLQLHKPVWAVGLIPALIGGIVFTFAYITEIPREKA